MTRARHQVMLACTGEPGPALGACLDAKPSYSDRNRYVKFAVAPNVVPTSCSPSWNPR